MDRFAILYREFKTAVILIPIGLFLTIFGIIVLMININNQNYLEVQAIVSNVTVAEEAYIDTDGNHVDATYDVNVKYSVDGKMYEGKLGGLSKYKVGDKMRIYYNPDNPKEITQTKSIILPILFLIGGIASLAIGVINLIKKIKNR